MIGLKLAGAALAVTIASAGSVAAQEWRDKPEVKALYEAAKKEGNVVVWGTQAKEVDWIPPAFEAAFPGIKVEFLGDNDIATKAITEARGGRHSVDVFQTSLNAAIPVDDRDLFTANDWSLFNVKPSDVTLKGRAGFSHTTAYALVYNTDQVKPADLPDTWLQMADPKYKGKMVASLFLLPRLIGGIGLEIGEDKAMDYARSLVAGSDLMLTRAPRETFLQTSERAIALGEIDNLPRTWMKSGLPVNYKILQPVITSQFAVSVMAGAPHPKAASLLAGYLASAEGRASRTKATLQYDYLPGSSDPEPAQLQKAGAKIVYDTIDNMAAREAIIKKISPILTGQAK